MVSYVVLLIAILSTVVFVLALVIGLAIAIIGKATKGKTLVLSQVRHGGQKFSRHARSP